MRRRLAWLHALPVFALIAWLALPLALGRSTLYLRDVSNAHAQWRIAQAEYLRDGTLPLVDPLRDGQPLVGNPNAVSLYPTAFLGVLTPPRWSLNAHFWLHLLLAPVAMFALGRAVGLRRPAAWAAGTVYATSGFALSHLNLLNSVAIMALGPAAVAAAIHLARARSVHRARRAVAVLGLLFGLLILGGDPPSAALVGLLALSALLVFARSRGPGRWTKRAAFGVAGLLGLLVAAPQIIELQRIVDVSMRGAHEASARSILAQSFDARSSVEWLVPLFYGRPDNAFWGRAVYGGNEPFYLSLFPGCLTLILVLASGRPRTRAGWWAWGAVAAGVTLALGGFNPLIRWAVEAFGGAGLRYPIKAWLLVAVGGSLLAGVGFERLRGPRGRRIALAVSGALLVVYAGLAWMFNDLPAFVARAIMDLAPSRLDDSMLFVESSRWSGLTFVLATLAGVIALLIALAGRRPMLAGVSLLAVHGMSQLFFLAPVVDTDDASFYARAHHVLLDLVPEGALVVHGRTGNLFGPPIRRMRPDPDARTVWDERRRYASLAPQAGVDVGRRYAFDPSPEGLDMFWTVALAQAVTRLGDLDRLRLLEAAGVEMLVLDRPIGADAASRVGLVGQRQVEGGPIWVYKLGLTAPSIGLATETHVTADPNVAMSLLRDPTFDPRTAVVLNVAPDGAADVEDSPHPIMRRPGSVDVVRETAERVVADVDSAEGATLVVQRVWLPTYRASVDGRPVPVHAANLSRIGIEVPAGLHRVRVWVDRRPFAIGGSLSAIGLILIATLVVRRRPERNLESAA